MPARVKLAAERVRLEAPGECVDGNDGVGKWQ